MKVILVRHGKTDWNDKGIYRIWQGLMKSELKTRYPELHNTWENSPEKVEIPDGETLNDVRKR